MGGSMQSPEAKAEHQAVTRLLVEKAKEGDQEAYDQLFRHAADRALLFIRLRLGPQLRAKLDPMDVLQEAYIEAHKAFDRFEYTGEDAFARWLCRIIDNCIRGLADYHSAKKRKGSKPTIHESAVLKQIRDSTTGVVTKADRLDAREKLAFSMESLDDEQREVLLLRHWQDLTIEEIANRMGRSPSAVRRLLGRATTRLGALLQAKF